jgi:TRAP transporter TAXI family solute receptor
MMKLKKAMCLIIAIMILSVSTGCSAKDVKNYTFAAASPGGTYYAMSGGFSTIFGEIMDGYSLNVQTTAGSAENIRLVNSGETDMGLANGSELYWAWNDEGVFQGQNIEDIRIVGFGWTNIYHCVVLEKSGINNFEDFKGKNIGVGPQGSAAAIFNEILLSEGGVWNEVSPVYLPPGDQVSAMKDGNLDVFGYFSGLPLSLIMDLSSVKDVKLLDIGILGDEFGFSEKYPFYKTSIIPAGTYEGQEEDVVSYSNLTYIIANKDVPEETVYEFLKALYSEEGLDHMHSVHTRASELSMDSIEKMVDILGIPMHQGAVRFISAKER